jgi:glutathione S-transferase
MPTLKLFFAPGACSRASLIALEESGAPFGTQLVRFLKGDHRAGEYLALNPKGKVPLLVVDGRPLTENVAILTWIARAFPERALLPFTGDPYDDAGILSLLAWCSSALHPLVNRLRMPQMSCDQPESFVRIRAMAAAGLADNFRIVEERLAGRDWYLDRWSLVDVYLYWAWFRATDSGFDPAPFPRFADHARRLCERPAAARALAREAEAEAWLESQGLVFKPPGR